MSAPARLAGFAVIVVLGFGGGWAIGTAVGPLDPEPRTDHSGSNHTDTGSDRTDRTDRTDHTDHTDPATGQG